MHDPSIDLSIIVPVYRSAVALPELHRRLVEVLEGLGLTFEICFIEDCGGDDSWSVIRELSAHDTRVRGLRMRRNYGQHNALLCGIREARGGLIATIDDDLQHPPEELPKLLKRIEQGFDVVYGPPILQQHGLWRDLASQVTKFVLQGAMGAATARQVSALRVFRAGLRDAFADFRGPMVNIDVLLTWGSTHFSAVPVRHEPRRFGESGYTVRKLIAHALNMMTGFSTAPLRFAGLIGLGFAAIGMLVFIFVMARYLIQGSSVPGFPFLASIVAIFSGVQLFALGIIGEYLARMHFRTMDRPAYVIGEDTRHEPS